MNKTKIASIPLVLSSKQSKIKIGKVIDNIDAEKCLIQKEGKNFKLIEKKTKKSEAKYTGTISAEQTSKYMLIRFNSTTNELEAYPTEDWYYFKKDIQYQTISLDEAEEKMKNKSGYMDYFKSKPAVIVGKNGRGKKVTEDEEPGVPKSLTIRYKEDENIAPSKRQELDDRSDMEDVEEEDAELKELPSDIEEEFFNKGANVLQAGVLKTELDVDEEDEESESSDSIFGIQDDDLDKGEEAEEDLSEIEEEYDKNNATQSGMTTGEFLGTKRKGDELSSTKGKKHKSSLIQMEDELNNLFSRNRQMTYEKIVKDLSREFTNEEIETNLKPILDRISKKFIQKGEYYYFKNLNN